MARMTWFYSLERDGVLIGALRTESAFDAVDIYKELFMSQGYKMTPISRKKYKQISEGENNE